MLIPCDEVNILKLHLKLLSTQGTGSDKLLSTQRVRIISKIFENVVCEQLSEYLECNNLMYDFAIWF